MVVQYHPLACDLAPRQARKLIDGGTIALKRSHCGGGSQIIHLTTQQHHRLSKGQGMRLRFSGVQIAHNKKHGQGLGSMAVNAAKAGVKLLGRKGVDAGAALVKEPVASLTQGIVGAIPGIGKPLGKLARKGVEKGVDLAASVIKNKLIGHGVKKPRGKKGKGLFSSVLGGLGNAADFGVNRLLGTGLYPAGYGGSLLPKPIKGVNSNSAGI